MSLRQTATEIEDEAVRWVLRLDKEGRTSTLEAEMEAWLAGDSRRRGALLQAEATWALLGGVQPRTSAYAGEPEDRRRRRFSAPVRWRPAKRSIRWSSAAAVAAGIAAVVMLPPRGEIYRTEVGEVRRVALEDRSAVAINTASRIQVSYQGRERRVEIDRGEAWFQVAKDPARPFVVEAGPVSVKAVGTAFSVRRRENGADILVTEGVVRAWVSGAEGHVVEVRAGGKAFVADNAAITQAVAPPSQIDRKLAWREGKIDLAGETLAEAAAEFNRYNVSKITIRDAELGRKRLYGVFRIDDPEGFARAAATSLGARTRLSGDGDTAIDEAEPAETAGASRNN